MSAPAATFPRLDGALLGLVACCAAAAAIAGWICVTVNRDRSCALEESIAAAFCSRPAAGSAAEAEMLLARIAREPGDSNAYAALAASDRSAQRSRTVDVAAGLAPRDPNLLFLRGAAAFDRRDWPAAVGPLTELLDSQDVAPAAQALVWLVQNNQASVLESHIHANSRWLTRLLAEMRRSQAPLSGAFPLIAKGLREGAIDLDTVRAYVRDLKNAGAWADAYALWLSMHGGKGAILFNAGFDHAFEADGFDWEVPGGGPMRRRGAIVERRPTERRGSVLEVQLTGRPIETPIVRQYLFIAPGRYRLRGEYLARQMRMEDGLVWSLRCGQTEAARSRAIDEDSLWHPFDFEFTVPPQCGIVAGLQLQPATATDGALGGHGRISFDAFILERTGP